MTHSLSHIGRGWISINIKITNPEDLIIAESILKDMDTIYNRREFIFQTR